MLGACRKLYSDAGKTPEEKLHKLATAAEESKWLRAGSKLGFYRRP